MPQFAFSVIIPHLNQPERLRKCLESLQHQTLDRHRFEIVVVDNGSRVLPVDICAAFPGVRLSSEPAPGPGPARNHGIGLAVGDFLAFVDADCVAHPGWLKAAYIALTSHPEAKIIGGDVQIERQPNEPVTAVQAYESVFAYRQAYYIKRLGFSGTGNLAMKREAFLAVGPFAGIEVAEDREWGQRATNMGFAVKYVPDMIVYHPARSSFSELTQKWDRHVSHDYAEKAIGLLGKIKWVVLAGLVAASGVVDMWKVIASPQIHGLRETILGCSVLLRIRLYRAMKMLQAMFPGKGQGSRIWNRGN